MKLGAVAGGDSEESGATTGETPAPPKRRRRRRWPRLLFLALLLTGAYWILSYSARPMAESWLSRTLGSRVEVLRVGFDPIEGVVTLEDLVAQLPYDSGLDGRPIVADRARLDFQWLPLVHKRLQIRELALEGAIIDLNQMPTSIPGLATLQKPTRPETLPAGWTLQVDRVALRDSVLRLPEVGPETKELEVTLHEADITATRRRTSVLGAARNLRLDASFEGGRLRAEGHYSQRDEGLRVMADVRAEDLPVAPVLQHFPELGIENLSGRLEAEMRYVFDERRNALSGWARVRDARLESSDDQPAFEVRNAIADVETVNLRGRSLRLRSLVLRGMSLMAEEGIASDLLASLATEDASKRRGDRSSRGWRWAIDRFDASDAKLLLAAGEEPIEVMAGISGENLGPRSHWSPVRARFRHGVVTASFDGNVRTSYDEPRLEGHTKVEGLELRALAEELKVPGAHLIGSGRVNADIEVLLEPSAAGAGVTGTVSLEGLSVEGGPAKEEAAMAGIDGAPLPDGTGAARAAEDAPPIDTRPADPPLPAFAPTFSPTLPVGLARAGLTDVMAFGADRVDLHVSAPAPAKRKRGPPPERRWTIEATLVGPYLRLARDEDGWVMPSLVSGPESEPRVDASSTESTAADAHGPAADTTEAGFELPDSLPLTLSRLTILGGRLVLADEAEEPLLVFDVDQIYGEARKLRLDPFTVEEMSFEGYDTELGLMRLRALEASLWGGVELVGEEIPLYLTAPYLERLGLPYRFAAGDASFVSELRRDPGGWTADTLLILNRPQVDSWTEDRVVPELLGMSLASAFGLLRDQSGDVRIHLPRLANLHDGFGVAVANAVQKAHESPASGGALSPTMIRFAPGQIHPRPESASQLRSIARMVGGHPNLRIELAAPASLQDRRALAEQDVLAGLEDRGGILDALSLLGVEDDYDRIRRALRMRAEGRMWRLDDHDEALLDELIREQPPVTDARLRALGAQRLVAVERLLREDGVSPSHLARRDLPGQDRTTLAGVMVTVRATRRPVPPSDDTRDGVL